MIILLGMVPPSPTDQSLDPNCSRYTLFLLEILQGAMVYNIKYMQMIMICTLPLNHSPNGPDTFNRAIANIESCILNIMSWMATNFLKLNDLKTDFLLIGSRYGALVPLSHIQIGNEQVLQSISAFFHIKIIGSIRNHHIGSCWPPNEIYK